MVLEVSRGVEYKIIFKNSVNYFDVILELMKKTKHYIDCYSYYDPNITTITVITAGAPYYVGNKKLKLFSQPIQNHNFFTKYDNFHGYLDYLRKNGDEKFEEMIRTEKEKLNAEINKEEAAESKLTDSEKEIIKDICEHPLVKDNIEYSGWVCVF